MADSELFPKDTKVEREETFIYGKHSYRRTDRIDLVSQLAAADGSHRSLHYYCDSLTCPNTLSVTLKLPPVMTIHIFARDFLTTVSSLSEIVFEQSALLSEQKIYIYPGEAPINLLVKSAGSEKAVALIHDAQDCPSILTSNFQNGAAMISHDHVKSTPSSVPVTTAPLDELLRQPIIEHDQIVQFVKAADSSIAGGPTQPLGPCPAHMGVGRLIRLQKGQPVEVWVIKDVPSPELEPPLTADLLELGSDLRRVVNLPKLLQQLFADVCHDTLHNPANNEISISRLRFIIRCIRSSSAHAALAANSQKLLDRLELPLRYGRTLAADLRYYAPQLGFKDLLRNTRSALAMSEKLETSIKEMDRDLRLDATWRQMYGTLLTEMGRNMSGFINSEENLNKAKDAIADCEAKRRDMEGYIASTKKAMDRFNAGIDSFIQRKRKELVNNIIAASMELLVSVGIAVATCGAGAPLTLGNLGKAQKAITEGVHWWDKIKRAVENLLNVCAKVLPKLQAAWQNQSKFNARVLMLNNQTFKNPTGRKDEAGKALNESAGRISAGSMPADVMTRVDFLGMIADWDEFDVSIDAMFEDIRTELGQENIDGMTEYKVALKYQAIRGRLVVVAMRNVQEAVQFYHRQEAEKLARGARRQELENLANGANIDLEKKISQQVLRWTMVQESATARQNLFVRCHQVFLALIYFTNRPNVVNQILEAAPIGPESSASDFGKMLQEMDDVYLHEQALDQSFRVEIDTHYFSEFFLPDWQVQLQKDQEFKFKIPHGKVPSLREMARVRVWSMDVKFEGMEDKGNPRDPLMWDWELGPAFTDVSRDGKAISYYMPTQVLRQIKQEGDWGDQWANLPRPSVFCQEGRIVFVKSLTSNDDKVDSDSLGRAPVDLSGVTKVSLTFSCRALRQGSGVAQARD